MATRDLERFAIADVLHFEQGPGGLTKAVITAQRGSAEIYLHGATVTHFQAKNKPPTLFLSKTSLYQPAKPIRGGIPVIFPWFGPHPTDKSIGQHGVVRTMEWEVSDTASNDNGSVMLELECRSTPETLKVWPYEFYIRYTIVVGDTLDLLFEVHNPNTAPFVFEEALHTYFNVPDIGKTEVHGLAGTEFIDKVDGGKRKHQQGPVVFTTETDRVYVNTPAVCTIHCNDQKIASVSKQNSLATVVWNPGREKGNALADLSGDQWPKFVCVETVNAIDHKITLNPGNQHSMRCTIVPA